MNLSVPRKNALSNALSNALQNAVRSCIIFLFLCLALCLACLYVHQNTSDQQGLTSLTAYSHLPASCSSYAFGECLQLRFVNRAQDLVVVARLLPLAFS